MGEFIYVLLQTRKYSKTFQVDLDLSQRFDPFLIATDNTSIFINNCQIVLSFIYFD